MNKVRKVINKHGLTQVQLGNLIGVTSTTVYRWASGQQEPSSEYIAMLEYLYTIPTKKVNQIISEQYAKQSKLAEKSSQSKNNIAKTLLTVGGIVAGGFLLAKILDDLTKD